MEDFPKTDVWKKDDGSSAVVYTYFEGDINSMVDAHFTRALNQSRPATNYYRHKLNSAVPGNQTRLNNTGSFGLFFFFMHVMMSSLRQ